MRSAGPWVRDALEGETVLTVGAAVDAWRRREVDGVLSVGPLECMPNKLVEAQRMLGEVFDPADVHGEAYGNVISATGFLYGFAAEELRPAELDLRDPDFEVVLGARATRSDSGP